MKLNADGLALLKHFESCLKPTSRGTFEAYPDPGYGWNVATIGWGTVQYENGAKVKHGDEITQARADELLEWEINEKIFGKKGKTPEDDIPGVVDLVKVPLTENQASALIVFAYNVGIFALKRSTLLRKLNAKDYAGAAAQFGVWNKSNGKVLKGLIRRRAAERALFEK